MLLNLNDLREEYAALDFDLSDVDAHPMRQFEQWFKEAMDSKVLEPNAMVLSTINSKGRPAARVVLLKEVNANGFVFFTNYQSRKGQELATQPFAALVFNWLELHRQVRIEGQVEKISPEASTAYFQSRPKGSQIGAWASPQSQSIPDRSVLKTEVQRLENEFENQEQLPRPDHWGGFIVKPELIEFWQGRPSRLHDRIQYQLEGGEWSIERLAP